jgi:hypothetical protein
MRATLSYPKGQLGNSAGGVNGLGWRPLWNESDIGRVLQEFCQANSHLEASQRGAWAGVQAGAIEQVFRRIAVEVEAVRFVKDATVSIRRHPVE